MSGKRTAVLAVTSAAILAVVMAAPLLAATAKDVIATRVAGFHELGAAFKNVNDELRSSAPQAIVLQLSARQIRAAAATQPGWFPTGSGPESGLKTAAKAEIWAQPAQFKAAQDAFAVQANAFYKVVASGDAAAIRVLAKQLGATCAACHRAFRAETR